MKSKISVLLLAFVLFTVVINAQKAPERLDGKAPKTYKAYIPAFTEDLSSLYPQNVDYWTGTTDGATKTQVSIVDGHNTTDGWMSFDVSSLPVGATINSVTFHGYVSAANWPYWSVTPMAVNPVSGAAADIYAAIQAGQDEPIAYLYSNESSSFTTGWHSYLLGSTVNADLGAAIVNGWFAVGISSRDNSATYLITFDGWNETNKPYLEVDYTVPVAHDVSTISVDIASLLGVGPFTPKATVKSLSTTNETFDVTMTISDGTTNVYTSTKTVTALVPGTSTQVSFDVANLGVETYTATVCTQLGGDPNATNNCLDKDFAVQDLIITYAYNAYDPTSAIPEGPATFPLQVPGAVTSIAATTSTEFIGAGTMVGSEWYGIEYYNAGSGGGLYKIDHSTGVMTLVGPTNAGVSLNGMAYDPVTGNVYAVSSTSLYTINTTTGAATLVGTLGAGITVAINLACSPAPVGQLYTVDIVTDKFYSVDKTTGAATEIGAIGFDASYAQDMEYDLDLDVCYMAAYNVTSGNGELRTVNVTTGATTLVGAFTNGAEICGFAIPYNRTVPVELTSFKANVNESGVSLDWSTATEINNSGFQVERSSGNSFEVIGFVGGHGTTTEIQNYSYLDNTVKSGTYTYRLKQIDFDGTFEYSNEIEVDFAGVTEFALAQNYPNPFNPSTVINFSLAVDSKVSLKIFDVLGQEVATLVNGQLAAGSHPISFNASLLNSGVYFYQIDATGIDGQNFTSTKKMILTK